MDLDKLKLKTTDELSPDEKLFIKENEDKLDDEDKAAYADFLGEATGSGQGDGTSTGEGEGGDAGAGSAGDGGAGAAGEGDGGKKTPAPAYTFQTEEEAKAFVAKTVAEEQAKQRQAAIDAAGTPAEKKWVEDNWKPKDWNEGIKVAVDAALKAVDEKNEKLTKAQNDAKEAYEKEWDGITTANKLPARTTEEGAKLLKAVFDIGTKYGQPNFTKAYDLYTKIPKDQGGGLEIGKPAPKVNPNREAASRVAGNTPGGGAGKSAAPGNYQDLHNKTQSQLIRDALKATA